MVQVSCFRDPARRGGADLLQAWPTLLDVARAAASAGVQVTLVQAAWRDETLERDGIRIHLVAEPGARVLPRRASAAVPLRLVRAVRALRPDVIHLQGLGFPVQTRLLCGTGIPVLAQDHKSAPPPPSRRPLHRWGFRRLAGAAFTGVAQAEPFRAAGVLPPSARVFDVLESSTHLTPGDVDEARAETGIGGDPCVLWIGRLAAVKDPMAALDGFARAAERLPDARLWMAHAEAPMEAAVRERIAADPRLRGRVRLLGRVPHERIEALCRAADLFVSASRWEAAGYAVLEAIACGATPLLSDIPPFRRILRGGAVGGLFAPGDGEALAALIVEHAAGPRAQARRAVRAHFDRHLSFDAVGRELRAAYEGVAR